MKSLSEQDHYEVLEITRDALQDGIERAYRLARATFQQDSLAGYSVVGDADSAAIRERIETAYRVLSDASARSAYDAALRSVETPPQADMGLFDEVAALAAEPGPVEEPAPVEPFEELEEEASGDVDGARLRRMRLRRGLDLDDVARVTKVNPSYLRFLEEDRFDELPARVYVRGFVTLYAGCLGLEVKPLADAYMRRFDDHVPKRRSLHH